MKRFVFVAGVAALLLGCQDDVGTGPDLADTETPLFEISDGLHNEGNPHFFFLRPIGRARRPSGDEDFNPDLFPVVEVCQWDDGANGGEGACVGDPIATFTRSEARGRGFSRFFDRIRLRSGWRNRNQRYSVLWRTRPADLEADNIYRISVRVGTQELGFADIQVVDRFREFFQVDRDEFVPLHERSFLLPIEFRIEFGAVCAQGVGTCVEETVSAEEGGTVTALIPPPPEAPAGTPPTLGGLTFGGLPGGPPPPGAFQGASVGGALPTLLRNFGRVVGMPVAAPAMRQGGGGQLTVVMQDCVELDEFGDPKLDGSGNPILTDLDVDIPTFGPCLDIKVFDELGERVRDLGEEATIFLCVNTTAPDVPVGNLPTDALTDRQTDLVRIHEQDDDGSVRALPLVADPCDEAIASVGSNSLMRFASGLLDRVTRFLAVEPLHARRRRWHSFHGGGKPPDTESRFQWALPAKMFIDAGDDQDALVGTVVETPPSVAVVDADSLPVKGATVTFTDDANGTAAPTEVVTGPTGIAAVAWTIDGLGVSELTATCVGCADPVNNGPQASFDPFTPIPGGCFPADAGNCADDPREAVLVDAVGMVTFTATGVDADLTIEILTHSPADPLTVDDVTVGVVVKNVGTTDAGPTTLEVSVNGIPQTLPVLPVPAGQSSVIHEFNLGTLAEGGHTVTATADLNDDVLETDETNNEATDLVTVTATVFGDGFETPSGWDDGGLWNRSTLLGSSPLFNAAYPDWVNLPSGDVSNAALPDPFEGGFVFYYGESATGLDETGNYMAQQLVGDALGSGGTSVSAHSGQLISPLITLPAVDSNVHSLILRFRTWFEIESVDAHAFDIMSVSVQQGAVITPRGVLNPIDDAQPTTTIGATPFTSGGFDAPPTWFEFTHDLTEFQGQTIQLIFAFNTGDALYNGFRSWLLDDLGIRIDPAGAGPNIAGLMAANSTKSGTLNPPTTGAGRR